jgi:hypothetical protein
MRYIITESRIENIIKDYILNNYDVMDVDLIGGKIHLGSGPNEKGQTEIEQKIIVVYINNIKGEKSRDEIRKIKKTLWDRLNGLFGINLDKYGSGWRLITYQVKREEV